MTAATWPRMLRSELRLPLRSVLVWSMSMAALVFLVVGVYPSIRDNHSFDSVYGNLSPTMQALLGGSSLTSATGYLSTQLFAFFLPAVLLVFAISRGAAAIAGEEEQHTLDLLLAQPIRRRNVYLQKSASVLIGIAALTVASWIPLAAMDSAVRFDVPVSHLTGVCLQMGLFCCTLALCAQAVAAAFGRRVAGIATVVAYTVLGYILYGLSMTVHALSYLR
ncbi:MAG TPA: ABC transporter permease subunit, partial [Mycobacteriales bacterium]|nr:ABC transporter permease subunit [Mycobacteriales bacterium]